MKNVFKSSELFVLKVGSSADLDGKIYTCRQAADEACQQFRDEINGPKYEMARKSQSPDLYHVQVITLNQAISEEKEAVREATREECRDTTMSF